MVGCAAPRISVIIPILNEAPCIRVFLTSLQNLRQQGVELILVDGGSSDGSIEIAKSLVDQLICAKSGRAIQMNAGAAQANGDLLIFLHADTELSANAMRELETRWRASERSWGRFNVRLSGDKFTFRVIEFSMNWRSKLTAIATGDQAIFVERRAFQRLGGYAEIPLMEDVEMCKRLKRVSKPICVNSPVITSSRRWEEKGVLKTVLLMWRLRLEYFFGKSPEKLVQHYYPERGERCL